MIFHQGSILEIYKKALKEGIESILDFAEIIYLECMRNVKLLKLPKGAKWRPTEKDETSIARIASFLLELMASCIDTQLQRIVYGDISREVIACSNGAIKALMKPVEPERVNEVGSAEEPNCGKLLVAMEDPVMRRKLLEDVVLHADRWLRAESRVLQEDHP